MKSRGGNGVVLRSYPILHWTKNPRFQRQRWNWLLSLGVRDSTVVTGRTLMETRHPGGRALLNMYFPRRVNHLCYICTLHQRITVSVATHNKGYGASAGTETTHVVGYATSARRYWKVHSALPLHSDYLQHFHVIKRNQEKSIMLIIKETETSTAPHWLINEHPESKTWVNKFRPIKGEKNPPRPCLYFIAPRLPNKLSRSQDSLTWRVIKPVAPNGLIGAQQRSVLITRSTDQGLPAKQHYTLINICWRPSGEEKREWWHQRRKKSIALIDW